MSKHIVWLLTFISILMLNLTSTHANPSELDELLRKADEAMKISGRSHFCAPHNSGKISCSVEYLKPTKFPCIFEVGSKITNDQVDRNWDGSWRKGTIVRQFTTIDFSAVNPSSIQRQMLGPIYFENNDQYVHLSFAFSTSNNAKMYIEVQDEESGLAQTHKVDIQFYFNSSPSYESLISANRGGFALSFYKDQFPKVVGLVKTVINKCSNVSD